MLLVLNPLLVDTFEPKVRSMSCSAHNEKMYTAVSICFVVERQGDQVNAMNSPSVVKILVDGILVPDIEEITTTRGTTTDTINNIVTTNPLRRQRQ